MSGHGHVYPNANGVKARCGGPALCSVCSAEYASATRFLERFDPTLTQGQQIARAMEDELARRVRTATVVKPGDHVLLTTVEPFAQHDLPSMMEQLRERFPGVEFTFVAGVTGIAVDRQDETDEVPS